MISEKLTFIGSLCLGGTTLPLPAPVVRSLNISEIDDGQINLGKDIWI